MARSGGYDRILSAGAVVFPDHPRAPSHVIDFTTYDRTTGMAACRRCHSWVRRDRWLAADPCRTTHTYGQLVHTDIGVFVACRACRRLLDAAQWMAPCPGA